MRFPLYQVDAFTDVPFGGNPAAVVLLSAAEGKSLDNATRQKIAAEMNLSETSFVELPPDQEGASFQTSSVFNLRWFTPAQEVPLCGHATIAAAAAVISGEGNTSAELVFRTVHSGELIVKQAERSSGFQLQMVLPHEAPTAPPPPWADAICKAVLGGSGVEVVEVALNSRIQYLLVELKEGTTREQLEGIKPDFAACLSAAKLEEVMLVIVTAKGLTGTHDFLSRSFAPWGGIDEDPVTGSAHAVLGPWWAQKLGKDVLTARQCSTRGGELKVTVDTKENCVKVLGNAVIVTKGRLFF